MFVLPRRQPGPWKRKLGLEVIAVTAGFCGAAVVMGVVFVLLSPLLPEPATPTGLRLQRALSFVMMIAGIAAGKITYHLLFRWLRARFRVEA